MLMNYKPSEVEIVEQFSLVFDDGMGNGFSFPCTEAGEPLPDLHPCAVKNLKNCMNHPEEFVRFNEVVHEERRSRTSPHGTCSCGEEIYLYDQYLGGCQCPKCGRWYNLFGQELNPVETWSSGEDW